MGMREDLEDIYNLAKFMKGTIADLIYFDNSQTIFTAYLIVANNYIRYTSDSFVIPESCRNHGGEIFNLSVIDELLKECPDNKKLKRKIDKLYIGGVGLMFIEPTPLIEAFTVNELNIKKNLILSYQRYIDRDGIGPAMYMALEETEQWNYIKSLKAGDGAKRFILDKYVMYIFNGLIPVVSSDRINVYIFDNPDYPYFMTIFDVLKKPKKNEPQVKYSCVVCFYKCY